MDNANYNFEIVKMLYKSRAENGNSTLFNKPIIVLLMAIVECMLFDFTMRIHMFKWDSFPNITHGIITHIRGARITDDLKYMLPRITSQNILRAQPGDSIYADLEHLRIVRNRIHIQNRYSTLLPDESNVFTDAERRKAEAVFERVCEVLCNVYPRWNRSPLAMADFPRPWL